MTLETTLQGLMNDSESIISSEFHLKLEKSKLKIYSPEQWKEFHEANKDSIIGFNKNDVGLYVPTSYSAYVRSDSPVVISNIFHEYFGHGLFCEHSAYGKTLVNLLQKENLPEGFMQDYLYCNLFTPNPSNQPWGIGTNRIGSYEGFALWMESWLCKATGNDNIWELKKNHLPNDYRNLFEYTAESEKHLTKFGFMKAMGFPKECDGEKVMVTLKNIYGDSFNNIDFVMLYGSKKPESDIDLLVVSKNPSVNFFNGWLDIYELNRDKFNELTKKLDISVTDPLFCGEVIYGDKNHVEELKRNVLQQPISQEAIHHNFARGRQQEACASRMLSLPTRDYENSLKYSKTYKINAEELSKGRKILTLDNMKREYNLLI